MSTHKIAGLRFSPDSEPEILGDSKLASLIEKPQFTVSPHLLKTDAFKQEQPNTSLTDTNLFVGYDNEVDDADTDRD